MEHNLNRFINHVVVVTGAGSGIGEATARRFSTEGASVVLVGRTASKLKAVAADLPRDRVLVHPADVSDQAAVEAMMAAAASRFKRIDTLVNNAGVAHMAPIESFGADDWRRLMQINVDGVFYCAKAVMPHLKQTGGSIVNVSSVSGLGGDWTGFAYNASKGAVSNFTRALALDAAASGVRVNAVNPSLTETDMTEGIVSNQPLMKKFADRMPMNRAAMPDEIAAVIAFLASDDAAFVNGVNLPVDGGLSASNGQPRLG